MFIGIVGCIGVGKSRLTKALVDHLHYRAFYEPVKENPYLDDFYADPKRYACIMQFFMLTQRFKQHLEIQELSRHNINVVQDQIIYGDVLYATLTHQFGYMDDRDFANYSSHFDALRPLLKLPDAIIHLDVDVTTALQRIHERHRPSELSISREYLTALSKLFTDWTDSVASQTHVIRLDWSNYQNVDQVIRQVEKKLDVQLTLPITTGDLTESKPNNPASNRG